MGQLELHKTYPFNNTALQNKELIISMLKAEETLIRSKYGQDKFKNKLNNSGSSLMLTKAFHREILYKFSFNTSDDDVEMYRSIFRTYFRSPTDYDKDVIEASHYMRNNRCVFYTTPVLQVGDIYPDCTLTTLNGTNTQLYNHLNPNGYTFVGAFSNS